MLRPLLLALAVALALGLAGCTHADPGAPLVVGAVYPVTGPQGPLGGRDEYRGALLAADLVNAAGGVGGRKIALDLMDVEGAQAAPGAIATLAAQGARIVVGSYGSTIARVAATDAARRGMLYWETGAVGMFDVRGAGRLAFRIAPSGGDLGRSAIHFIASVVAPRLHRRAATLRFAVANVDDAYGSSVAQGAVAELHTLGLRLVGEFPYNAHTLNAPALVRRIAAVHPDVLFVSAYLKDGEALRRATVAARLPLVASIGTSSSYCLPAFGKALGTEAVGLFASDKPDGYHINPAGLRPGARALLARANAAYYARYDQWMSAPALAGFTGAWVLFHMVLRGAGSFAPTALAARALALRVPMGGLPNGSGVELARAGTSDAGSNLRAASVIWEWVAPGREAVVWPPSFAEHRIDLDRIV